MNTDELKKRIKQKHLDRRDIAKKLNISPSYLNLMLTGWAPLKMEIETLLLQEIERGKKNGKRNGDK